jgi:hypothetical protein
MNMIELLEGHVKVAEAMRGQARIDALVRLIDAALQEINFESRRMGVEEAEMIAQAASGVVMEGTEGEEE